MTELNLTRDHAPPSAQREPENELVSRWRRTTLAGLLSLLIAGMGQLYNRQPRKALWLAFAIPILLFVAVETRLLLSFYSMVVFFTIITGWRIFVAAEAAHTAWAVKKPETALGRTRITYPSVAVVLLVAALYPSTDDFKHWAGFAAYKVTSASMCPTICLGERVVADMSAYKLKAPQRGDLVLLKHKSSSGVFIKHVIGITGDVVSPGPNGSVLINGKPLIPPQVCGSPVEQKANPADYPMFKATRVLEGFFVVGDNLGNSFDSRIPEFGPVTSTDLRGKPLFLYWSPVHSRIACPTR